MPLGESTQHGSTLEVVAAFEQEVIGGCGQVTAAVVVVVAAAASSSIPKVADVARRIGMIWQLADDGVSYSHSTNGWLSFELRLGFISLGTRRAETPQG
jgi:hypothetical protein